MNEREKLQAVIEWSEVSAKEARAKLAALDAEKPARWKPETHKQYWTSADPAPLNNFGGDLDDRLYAMGDVWQTQAEADAEYERRCVLARMRDIAAEAGAVGDGWYYINAGGRALFADCLIAAIWPGAVRFPTKESAERAIAELGDRLRVLL